MSENEMPINVNFLGSVSDAEKLFLAKCKLLVLPSNKNSGSSEQLLEAFKAKNVDNV